MHEKGCTKESHLIKDCFGNSTPLVAVLVGPGFDEPIFDLMEL